MSPRHARPALSLVAALFLVAVGCYGPIAEPEPVDPLQADDDDDQGDDDSAAVDDDDSSDVPPDDDDTTPPPTGVVGYEIGPEETAGNTEGVSRPSVAVDAAGQPHVVADLGNPRVYVYHRYDGQWTEALFAESGGDYDASRVYLPHLEIDPDGRGWVSAWFGVKEWGTMQGQGLWRLDDIADSPDATFVGLANPGFKNGNLCWEEPGQVVVMTKTGRWERWGTEGATGDSGQLDVGASGEKIHFLIARAPEREPVWHVVMSGYSEQSSAYRSSSSDSYVTWADYASYPEMGEDMRHPGLGVDGADPEVGYMAIGYDAGVVFNVWDGDGLVFDPAALPVLDASPAEHGNGDVRFGPQWAPDPLGGAFLCWTDGSSQVRLAHVDPTGVVGEAVIVSGGRTCAMATDPGGDLHIVYVQGGLRYRRVTVVRG